MSVSVCVCVMMVCSALLCFALPRLVRRRCSPRLASPRLASKLADVLLARKVHCTIGQRRKTEKRLASKGPRNAASSYMDGWMESRTGGGWLDAGPPLQQHGWIRTYVSEVRKGQQKK